MKELTLEYMDELEKEFSLCNYQGLKTEKESFKILEGTKKILISCPHSIDQIRNGMLKPREIYSGAIGKLIHESTGAHLIYKYHNDGIDDNFVLHTKYKRSIGELIKENDIKIVIDIHGMVGSHSKRFRGDFIELGTDYGENLLGKTYITEELKKIFSVHGIDRVATDVNFKARKETTISKYISKFFSVPAIQIETSGDVRNAMDYELENVKKLIRAFDDIVAFLDISL